MDKKSTLLTPGEEYLIIQLTTNMNLRKETSNHRVEVFIEETEHQIIFANTVFDKTEIIRYYTSNRNDELFPWVLEELNAHTESKGFKYIRCVITNRNKLVFQFYSRK